MHQQSTEQLNGGQNLGEFRVHCSPSFCSVCSRHSLMKFLLVADTTHTLLSFLMKRKGGNSELSQVHPNVLKGKTLAHLAIECDTRLFTQTLAQSTLTEPVLPLGRKGKTGIQARRTLKRTKVIPSFAPPFPLPYSQLSDSGELLHSLFPKNLFPPPPPSHLQRSHYCHLQCKPPTWPLLKTS
jgi:hypothetical protein